jgi:hypothetical protein
MHQADQPPLVAAGHLAAGLEAEVVGRGRYLLAHHRHTQAIADSGEGEDDGRILFAQGFAKLGDGGGERAFHDSYAGPDGLQQFLLGDHFARAQQQLVEHFQWLRFKVYHGAVEPQLAAGFVEFAVRKPPVAAGNASLFAMERVRNHEANFLSSSSDILKRLPAGNRGRIFYREPQVFPSILSNLRTRREVGACSGALNQLAGDGDARRRSATV